MVICLERCADLHMAQLMPLLRTVSCFSKIQIVFTFLVPAHPGSPGKRAVKRVLNMIKQDSRKNNKFDATRCQMLRQNAFDFRWGSAPDTARGAYIAPPDALAVFKEAYF